MLLQQRAISHDGSGQVAEPHASLGGITDSSA